MSLVDVRQAAFAYGALPVFEEITFTVNPGEIFCLIGPNGCGKTTLLDCLLGFHAFTSGSFQLMQKDGARMSPRRRAHVMAYVPQIHERTFPYSVREIVTMGRSAHLGFFESPSHKDRSQADAALERIGIGHLSRRPYTQLSGGEVRLVMIARALVQQTPVIVMDEPTAHLDFHFELVILETIAALVREKRLAIIMATHFPNHALYFQSQHLQTTIALFHHGRFLSVGVPNAVIDKERIETLYGIQTDVITITRADGRTIRHIIPLNTIKIL
ncbi:MAG: ABC transporter ATP-binding protein [Desulfatitalea sp.]|nr:ABC transporter ATP-binding protein [Desulfatitalea sp.]NNJ99592.1 ABC transporter ATP-binding protein [Desulfatitalea sp.]